jgi:spore maturation protein CgeB
MEALACGPLVLTDPMLSLPKGLSQGENIVFYHNMTDLRKKILFYLKNDTERIQIAQKGWKEAMSRHRSWHVAEDVLLGEIKTKGMFPNKARGMYPDGNAPW